MVCNVEAAIRPGDPGSGMHQTRRRPDNTQIETSKRKITEEDKTALRHEKQEPKNKNLVIVLTDKRNTTIIMDRKNHDILQDPSYK